MKQVKKGPPTGAIYMEDIDYDDEEYVNELIADRVLPPPSNEENLDDEVLLIYFFLTLLLTETLTYFRFRLCLILTILRLTNQNFH